MNDQFVGDSGDFGKFGLLRCLAQSGLTIGLVWYYTTGRRTGGGLTAYLNPSRSSKDASSDPVLHRALGGLVARGATSRTVMGLEQAGLLPASTRYFREVVPRAHTVERVAWLGRAKTAVDGTDLVFLDPDNGLASDDWKMSPKTADRYALVSEARSFWASGSSVVIYHHAGSNPKGNGQGLQVDINLHRKSFLDITLMRALVWSEGSPRAYLVLARSEHEEKVRLALSQILSDRWPQYHSA